MHYYKWSGLLGRKHAEAVLIGNGVPVLAGINRNKLENVRESLGIHSNTIYLSRTYNGQDEEFVNKYVKKVSLGRMSKPDGYVGTALYMISDASSFMNGETVVIEGGKSIWL